MRTALTATLAAALVLWASPADAQTSPGGSLPSPYAEPPPPPQQPTAQQPSTQPPPPVGQPQAPPGFQAAYPPYQPPPRTVTAQETGPNRRLWMPGIIMFGVSYLVALSVAAVATDTGFDDPYTNWLYAPLVGPWGALAQADLVIDGVFAVVNGLVQAAGMLMFILGFTLNQDQPAMYAFDDDPASPRLGVDVRPIRGGAVLQGTLSHF